MKKTDELIVNCPTCQVSIVWNESNPYRPFCSERCKLIDLGEWANEEYKIPTNELSEDELWSSDDHSFSN